MGVGVGWGEGGTSQGGRFGRWGWGRVRVVGVDRSATGGGGHQSATSPVQAEVVPRGALVSHPLLVPPPPFFSLSLPSPSTSHPFLLPPIRCCNTRNPPKADEWDAGGQGQQGQSAR